MAQILFLGYRKLDESLERSQVAESKTGLSISSMIKLTG